MLVKRKTGYDNLSVLLTICLADMKALENAECVVSDSSVGSAPAASKILLHSLARRNSSSP